MYQGMRGMHRARGGLRYWIFYLLRDRPMNGAEIMNEIESSSMGFWKPSPGSIYPLLESLSDEGLIVKKEDGRYELTKEGKANAGFSGMFGGHNPRSVEDILAEIGSYLSYMEDLKTSDAEKIKPFSDKLKELSERLKKIAGQ